jgi:ribosomal protein S12 methylthiotransferase
VTTVAIVTLGCGRNEVDSDQLAGLFHREGMGVSDDPAGADVVLVNTCTFIAPAKQESIDTILEACDLGAEAVLVVGCMAERYPDELAEAIPEAAAIVGFDGYGRLPQLVDDILAGRPYERVTRKAAPETVRRGLPLMVGSAAPAAYRADRGDLALGLDVAELPPEAPRGEVALATAQDLLDRVPASGPRFPVRVHDGRPWAYLKLASGCDRVCTFCAIPSFRGRFRSRPVDELTAEAAWLVTMGPSGHHLEAAEIAPRLAAVPEPVRVTLAARVSRYRPIGA